MCFILIRLINVNFILHPTLFLIIFVEEFDFFKNKWPKHNIALRFYLFRLVTTYFLYNAQSIYFIILNILIIVSGRPKHTWHTPCRQPPIIIKFVFHIKNRSHNILSITEISWWCWAGCGLCTSGVFQCKVDCDNLCTHFCCGLNIHISHIAEYCHHV